MSGDQPHFLYATVFWFRWDHFFDQGERVFEAVLLVLWLAFVVFLAFSAIRVGRENAKKSARSRRKRRDSSADSRGKQRLRKA